VTVVVRAAVPDDADAVDAVRFASWRAAYGDLIPAAFFDEFDRAAAISRWRAGIVAGDRQALVAEQVGPIVGFCSYGNCRDADLPAAGEVYALYAHPDHWSTGVGRALLSRAIEALANRPIVLWVLRDNARARRFYEIAGLTADGASRDTTMLGGVALPEVRYRLR
jgi:GNAT superfamily N-acetyltransferase